MRNSLVLFLCLLTGCSSIGPGRDAAVFNVPTTDPTHELSQNPTIAITAPQDWAMMTLHGIHLRDDASSINPKMIRTRDKGWILLRDANRIRIGDDGTVNALGIWQQQPLAQLGIVTQDDIAKKFGKPDHTLVLPDATIYLFQGQHIHVMWRGMESRVVGLNIEK